MLLRRDSSYPSTTCYGVAQHSVEAVQDVLQNVRPTAAGSVTDAFDDFVGYLMLDALIGNTDRHHENWAVISRRPDTHRAVLTLAPSYDHASSLGRELSDLKRRGRLDSSGRGTVANYAEKAWSAFHDPDGNKLTPLGALKRAANFRPRTFSLWQTLLRITPFDFFVAEVQRVPETRLSSVGKTFTAALLQHNRQQILELNPTPLVHP